MENINHQHKRLIERSLFLSTEMERDEIRETNKNVTGRLSESSASDPAASHSNVGLWKKAFLPMESGGGASVSNRKGRKETYAFWDSQPVMQFDDVSVDAATTEGPIDDASKTTQNVRQTPFPLIEGFEWCECDVRQEDIAAEVYKLLTFNYVEDDDMMFRFDYSAGFLKWALLPPGFRVEWLVGVRVTKSQKLVGFISAIPASVRVNSHVLPMVEINFLCVHKKLRSKRLAPVLIKEITRRVNLHNVWQATYTAGAILPTPIARCQYWHRALNPKKLIECGFSKLSSRMTMAMMIKLHRLPKDPETPGFRKLRKEDCPQVKSLLENYLKDFKLAAQFSWEDIEHWLLPRENVVDAYVVEDASGKITDLTSFYSLPSSILGNDQHSMLRAAYMYYTVPGSVPLKMLMKDALVAAKNSGFDVFNALDVLENKTFLRDLKFGEGDGYLQYYLYNWRVVQQMQSSDIGLILL